MHSRIGKEGYSSSTGEATCCCINQKPRAKVLAVLILIPWALDFVAHDYVLMLFLARYVKTVPLVAHTLDVRRSQKLEMVKELNREKSSLELREEWRLENRKAFANIWSDMVFGISLFALLYANQDTGKAFLIILIPDIFLWYHSESGWETLLEIIMEHYGLEVEKYTITIFICLVPVVMDACVKL
uniref:Uncharacterized protein n=1 Tax=Brassica campestris TaxID=3711 RepID=M4E5H3_BRACM